MRFATGLLSLLLATTALTSPTPRPFTKRQKKSNYEVKEPPLTTPWTHEIGTNPWPEYPRPQLQRGEWQNLNGIWRYHKADSKADVEIPPPADNPGEDVLVPSCLESGLSGGSIQSKK